MQHAQRALSNPGIRDIPGESRAEFLEHPHAPNRKAAVSVLFSAKDDAPAMLLIKRAANIGNHRTEWAFPGGSVEPQDESLLRTALRETQEELGIDPSHIQTWGPLPKVVTGTGYEVWPFTGYLLDTYRLTPDPQEVDDVVFIPIRSLTDPSSRRQITLIANQQSRRWDAIAYQDRIIWGATARIIKQAMNIIYPEEAASATRLSE